MVQINFFMRYLSPQNNGINFEVIIIYYEIQSIIKRKEKTMSEKITFGDFENVISLIPKLEKFAQTVKTKPDVILNELIELGYRVIDRAKDEAIKEASEKFKIYIDKKNFKFSENSIDALQSLVTFLKKQNEEKNLK